jgi:hypothetical protein
MTNCYNNGIIYKLCCKDTTIKDIYIGSTCSFRRRKNAHKTSCQNETNTNYNCYVYQFIRDNGGFSNWEMIEIKKVNCNDKRELEKEERAVLELVGGTLNSSIPSRGQNERNKIYKLANKEQLYKNAKEKVKCECGGKFTKSHKSQHLKTKKHKQYLEIN